MPYEKLNLKDGGVLRADHIKHLETGIAASTRIRKVWENSNPDAVFAAQTVSVDLSGCGGVFVDYLSIIKGSAHVSSGLIPIGGSTYATFYHSATGTIMRRSCRAYKTTFSFTDGASDDPIDNTVMIPVAIYGVGGFE